MMAQEVPRRYPAKLQYCCGNFVGLAHQFEGLHRDDFNQKRIQNIHIFFCSARTQIQTNPNIYTPAPSLATCAGEGGREGRQGGVHVGSDGVRVDLDLHGL